jgi:uncharacterized protein YsxB (DUF464 family)
MEYKENSLTHTRERERERESIKIYKRGGRAENGNKGEDIACECVSYTPVYTHTQYTS